MTSPLQPGAVCITCMLIALTACNTEIGESKDVNQEAIYQHYQITLDQANADSVIEVFAQFRFAGENGTTLVLNAPSTLHFNNVMMPVDSNASTGAFYLMQQPLRCLQQKPVFNFLDLSGRHYRNAVHFSPPVLIDTPLLANTHQDLTLHIHTPVGSPDDFIEVASVNTDSSFSFSQKLSQETTLTIPAKELQRQTGDRLVLQLQSYQVQQLQQSTKEGGDMIFMYHAKPFVILLQHKRLVAMK